MDLLLERRYNLDAMVTKKEQERRANDETEERRQVREGGREGGREGEREGGRVGVRASVHT